MSGFAVAFGASERESAERMNDRMRHRGPAIHGTFKAGRVVMAQRYLAADVSGLAPGEPIPEGASLPGGWRICYDGQIGNVAELGGEYGVPAGPLWEERLVLQLHAEFGSDFLPLLTDAIFALVVSNGSRLLAARDLLGIKTLFYARKGEVLYFASELKAIMEITDEVFELPPGHYMREDGSLRKFARLPRHPPPVMLDDVDVMIRGVRIITERSVLDRVDFSRPTGSLLSGGIDSSVVTMLAARHYGSRYGEARRLRTLAVGTADSKDLENARLVAKHLGTEHHEMVIGLEELLAALPDVIYYLESFDASLVRSSVANYLISRKARELGMEILLSGQGGDEVFCGYALLQDCGAKELHRKHVECLEHLHNTVSLRLDRMNQCSSIRVVAPLISGELLAFSFAIPPQYRIRMENKKMIEKWIFRKAFESDIPEQVVWRTREELSRGSGSAALLAKHFEGPVRSSELAKFQADHPFVRSKEELHYFNLFASYFGKSKAVDTVGRWLE
jgi:asparagine synthase (glutamine-hydrolysing)